MNLVRQVAASSILGVGFTLVVASGNIDLSVGTMIGLIGALTALLSKVPGVPMIAVLVPGICIGVLCGGFNALMVNLFNLPAFIVTLATMSVYKGICYLTSNSTPVSQLPEWYKTLGQGYVGPVPIPIIIMIAVALIGWLVVSKTVFGRNAMAIGGNADAARVCGVKTKKVLYGVYMFMGACAAVTAFIITGRSASAQPMAGQGMEMDCIAAVVIGGTALSGGNGRIIGTVVGCLLVGTINNGLNLLNVDSNWQLVAKGAIILAAVILDAQSQKFSAKALKQKV